MKALSIQQPWAWLIANGYKTVENRDWDTNVRGEVLIHAGKKYDADGEAWVRTHRPEVLLPKRETMPCGGIVGRARLVRVVPDHVRDALSDDEKRWAFGRFMFIFADAKPLPFTPMRGQLGFFAVEWDGAPR